MSFGATQAIRQVDLDLRRGEVHALLGGNGAGKSTLVKILLGALHPTKGGLEVEGEPVIFRSVRHAISKGIFPIYQHLSQFPDLTVRENLAAFSLGMSRGLFAAKAMPSDETMCEWLAEVGLSVSLDALCRDLSIGEMQLLEIARAIAQEAKVLVLDEPTAALTHAESEILLKTVERLRERDTAILFISHKLDEVVAVADRLTVIRDGVCAISGAPMEDISTRDIVLAMVGKDVAPITDIAPHGEDVVAAVRGLTLREGAAAVDFEVARGEIVGLAGIVGSGADRIAEAIAGAVEPLSGGVWIEGVPVNTGRRKDAVVSGIGFVPADRHADGVFSILGALQNTSAASHGLIARWGLLQKRREHQQAHDILKRIGLFPFRLEFEAADFSGGNQQKLVVARNLLVDGLKLLVMSEPTRGVDVAARRAIHEVVLEVSQAGVAVIVASSDIDELLSICHRVLIVQDHVVTGAFARGAQRQDIIGALAGAAA
jgi:ribose transport system ATP-binding protein/rhamnose transport system ATP-binding protein